MLCFTNFIYYWRTHSENNTIVISYIMLLYFDSGDWIWINQFFKDNYSNIILLAESTEN